MREKAAWYWDKRGGRGERKESELGLASGLLAKLELRERVVTGDALYAQRELSLRVLGQGGDYFWALKHNQPSVKEAVSLLFEQPPWGESFTHASQEGREPGGPRARRAASQEGREPGGPRARRAASQEGRHGDRWERRRLWASTALNDYLDWPGLAQVCCVERTRRHTDQEAQGQRDGRTGLCHHQSAAGAGGRWPVAGDMAWALRD